MYLAKHDILLNEFKANVKDYKIKNLYRLVIVAWNWYFQVNFSASLNEIEWMQDNAFYFL